MFVGFYLNLVVNLLPLSVIKDKDKITPHAIGR